MTTITINTESMPYSPKHIECVRFAGRVGGVGIGCCGIDIFQGFNNDPDAECMIPLVYGDALTPIGGKKQYHLGPTNKDAFLSYLRIGTYDSEERENRVFLAAIAADQLEYVNGNARKWLAILKEQGFEFIRTVGNSVYSYAEDGHPVHLFGLFRNLMDESIMDPFKAPDFWEELPEQTKTQQELWDELPLVEFLFKEKEKESPASSPFSAAKAA